MTDDVEFEEDLLSSTSSFQTELRPANLKEYLKLIKMDSLSFIFFMIPGMLYGLFVFKLEFHLGLLLRLSLGLLSFYSLTSASSSLNNFLDVGFDKYHPLKQVSRSRNGIFNQKLVFIGFAVLSLIGLLLASLISIKYFIAAIFIVLITLLYNLKPIRLKDRVFLDVLSESLVNPVRFAAGWFLVSPALGFPSSKWDLDWINTLPPISIIIAFWMGGAFLMATKRFAEFRLINDHHLAKLYRRSFKFYSENSLLISILFYAVNFAFFMGIFLIKEKIELLLSFPFFAVLFAWYLKIGLLDESPLQGYKKIYSRKWFMIYLLVFFILFIILMFIKIPWLYWLVKNVNNY
ncbi:UbiA family prenyltransferase [Pedobacter aquatilis]|uniref:UbiA family prenyltransferase n=1 Tax=Pedobacter aquatilis TaxID=351343 RepID=UPI00292DB910|nr:UbiA family prenyltransferase [Pedobacter aquatilis]